MAKRWAIPAPASNLDEVASLWQVSPIVAQLLLNRGLSSDVPVDTFLAPQLKDLLPPEQLPGAVDAANLLASAIDRGERIAVYGDYDVDGITGVSILWHVLDRAGADVTFYVPHRVDEGYGLNLDAVRHLAGEGARVIVTVDCGITAVDVAEAIREDDLRLIITDHHTPHAVLPPADVIVHPGIAPGYGNTDCSGAGVALKVAWALARRLSDGPRVSADFRSLLLDMLPLATLGTIADVVPLTGENRILARHGLARLVDTNIPGLIALIQSAGLQGRSVNGYDVGFKLAPRLNAAGRMGHARLAVELLTRVDEARAREIALYLEEHNRLRQRTERAMVRQAVERVERENLASDARRAIVLAEKDWHPGVLGIVAARLVEKYHRPTVLIALGDELGQGSGRSIARFDLNDALSNCAHLLDSYGGHRMAAGLRIAPDRVDRFAERFVQVANNRLTGEDLVAKLEMDGEAPLDCLSIETVDAITGLGPFGIGNPRPRFATAWVDLAAEPRCVGVSGEHLQVQLRENGATIRGIGFGLASAAEDLKHHRRCRVAFEPMINEFNGRRSAEIRILDFQFP